jgi:hypothetical protein
VQTQCLVEIERRGVIMNSLRSVPVSRRVFTQRICAVAAMMLGLLWMGRLSGERVGFTCGPEVDNACLVTL